MLIEKIITYSDKLTQHHENCSQCIVNNSYNIVLAIKKNSLFLDKKHARYNNHGVPNFIQFGIKNTTPNK